MKLKEAVDFTDYELYLNSSGVINVVVFKKLQIVM